MSIAEDFHIKLDYREASLADLDKLLQMTHDDNKHDPVDKEREDALYGVA